MAVPAGFVDGQRLSGSDSVDWGGGRVQAEQPGNGGSDVGSKEKQTYHEL